MTKQEVINNIDQWASGKPFDFAYENFIDLYSSYLEDSFIEIREWGAYERSEWQRIEVLEKLYKLYSDCGGLNE